ncbi:type II secretion system protein [Halorientalis brevis]|uniref:Type II secretion system protein n=1 Tax=Halorientalis brevis TaxID=1126241 RepID=A0ABD6CAC6_9EURY|nr:type II secretion system protein [Halorientalis brevis]
MHPVERAVAGLARLYPWPVETSEELDRALGFLGTTVTPATVVRAGYGTAVLCIPLVVVGVVLSPAWLRPLAGVAGLATLVGLIHVVHTVPKILATARRTRALGEAPALVSRAVLRMRITPATEAAAGFAAETGQGPLAASLREHVRRAAGTPSSGLADFTTEWNEWFPALRRALLLVEAAGTAPAGERERTLDRGIDAVLDGARDEMGAFAASLQGPAAALYAFGVLLPLALVALLPAVGMTGVSVPVAAIVLVYDLLLPGVLLAASAWLLVRRPVTFPPPRISRSHPALPDRRWPPVVAGIAAAAASGSLVPTVLGDWTGPLAAVGCGVSVTLIGHYRPVKAIRDRVTAVEDGLADALYHVGRRVEEGQAVETAIAAAAEEVSDATGEVFADAAHRQRQLKVSVREAFLGEFGALATLPSTRGRSTATLLALAAREGKPAGGAIVAMADHLEELATVERDARHRIGQVTSTLANTAAIFAPLVAGATVALADGMTMDGAGTMAASGPGTAGLGLSVGIYVLVLAALLTTLATGLSRGLDRALVGYRVGWAVLAATATYLASFSATGLLL